MTDQSRELRRAWRRAYDRQPMPQHISEVLPSVLARIGACQAAAES